jgi:hypothetical protein
MTREIEINNAMIFVLGGGEDAGVNPIGLQDRVNELPANLPQVVQSYIDRTMSIPLPDERSLAETGNHIAQILATEMPELSSIARTKLASFYTYQWR